MKKFLTLLAAGSFSCLAFAAADAAKAEEKLPPPSQEVLPPPPVADRPEFGPKAPGEVRERRGDFGERRQGNRNGEGRNGGKGRRMQNMRFQEQMMWRTFNNLDEKEKQELMALQRENPERFRSIMREKTEKIMRERRAKMKQMRKLVGDIRSAEGEKKAELTKELKTLVRKDYEERLQEHRKHIAEMKARTSKLEKELEERSSKIDAEVDKISEGMIRGDEPPKGFRGPNANAPQKKFRGPKDKKQE